MPCPLFRPLRRNNHGEAFCPVCLPHYNDSGYLHGYIHYLDSGAGLYLVLLAGSSDAFHRMAAARAQLEQCLVALGVLKRLKKLVQDSASGGRMTVESLPKPLGEPPLHKYTDPPGLAWPTSSPTTR